MSSVEQEYMDGGQIWTKNLNDFSDDGLVLEVRFVQSFFLPWEVGSPPVLVEGLGIS